MKRIVGAVCASAAMLTLFSTQAWANPQHERMKRCNAEAREQTLKGDARKAFMSTCLRGKHEAAPSGEAASAQAAPMPAAGPVQAAGAAAALTAPAGGTTPAAPAATPAATPALAAAGNDEARSKACNQSAAEQSLRGAKKKAFIAECLKG